MTGKIFMLLLYPSQTERGNVRSGASKIGSQIWIFGVGPKFFNFMQLFPDPHQELCHCGGTLVQANQEGLRLQGRTAARGGQGSLQHSQEATHLRTSHGVS